MNSNDPNILPHKMYVVFDTKKSDQDNDKYIGVYTSMSEALLACNALRNKKVVPGILTVPVNKPIDAIIQQMSRGRY